MQVSILSSTLFLQYLSVLWQHIFYPGCLKFGLYQPSLLYCAEQKGIPIIVKPFSTIVLNRGCHYQTTVKTQLVWLFCFTKLSILISSSLKYIVMAILSFVMYCFLISEHAVLGSSLALQKIELEGTFSSALEGLFGLKPVLVEVSWDSQVIWYYVNCLSFTLLFKFYNVLTS